MKWNKFTLKTRSEVEDIVISTLADVGIEAWKFRTNSL